MDLSSVLDLQLSSDEDDSAPRKRLRKCPKSPFDDIVAEKVKPGDLSDFPNQPLDGALSLSLLRFYEVVAIYRRGKEESPFYNCRKWVLDHSNDDDGFWVQLRCLTCGARRNLHEVDDTEAQFCSAACKFNLLFSALTKYYG